jgi:hypothetical protein
LGGVYVAEIVPVDLEVIEARLGKMGMKGPRDLSGHKEIKEFKGGQAQLVILVR